MRFTRLRLNGFKSFVDPTEMVIADGQTGIVGPNGCGKSNLLEALRWVMGENRPTAVRGGGMEDVIFAGASTRPARHFAEVSLNIDNSERRAPAGFNDDNSLDIVRRITRDAGSAYKANGKEVRARDVQMLFADASTGAHSPALVRQGQIAELVNARPRSRRRILEEAAGISGLYQRRHEAELKLSATETNLARVDDVVEQLAAQLAQLARQAKQAARYREIGTQLRRAEGLLLYRRWKDADNARALAEEALLDATRAAGQAEVAARDATRMREEKESALPPLREEEAISGAVLQRLQVQRDTLNDQENRAKEVIRTLEARISQLARDIERESGLNRDAGETIERLEWEQEQLARAGEGFDDRLADAADAAREAADILAETETSLSAFTEDVARLAARHQSAHRRLSDALAAAERGENAAEEARNAAVQAEDALNRASEAFTTAEAEQEEAQAITERAEATLTGTESARAEAQGIEAETRGLRAQADGEAGTLQAEVAALARLLERDSSGGAQLIDHIRVATGYEKALGAALADDLRAAITSVNSDESGWRQLEAYEVQQPLPAGAESLQRHVSAPEVLARRLSQVGLVSKEDGLRLQASLSPGQRLISLEGDLWRWDGLHTRSEDASGTAALRLQQVNRLEALRRELGEAQERAASARKSHDSAQARLADLTRADQMARDARRAADKRLADAARALSQAEAARNIASSRLETAQAALTRHEAEASEARAQAEAERQSLEALDDLEVARAQFEALKQTMEAARITMMSRRADHDELRRDATARLKRSQEITKEISGWRHRLESAGNRIAELRDRKAQSESELSQASAAPEDIAAKRAELADAIGQCERRRTQAMEVLVQGETELRRATEAERSAERSASEAREARARAEARVEAARETVALSEERISDALNVTPQALRENLGPDPETERSVEAVDAEVARLRRARDALGAVNLRAEDDARAVQEEHDGLLAEKSDLQAAVAKLRAGIGALNREGRERLLTAFEQVNANFTTLFTHLFSGGEAKLVLVESDDPLEAGLEIMCQPPGKKLATLSLLSGGEQTLTALALIFALFLANPAPICVLDEVDAPLDDANVSRFCDLLDEMSRRTETRFLIITHNAITMSRMDRLFGVTMGEQGVSQLVSVDLKRAEAMVA